MARSHFAPRHADLSELHQHLFHQGAGVAVKSLQFGLYVQYGTVRLADRRLDPS